MEESYQFSESLFSSFIQSPPVENDAELTELGSISNSTDDKDNNTTQISPQNSILSPSTSFKCPTVISAIVQTHHKTYKPLQWTVETLLQLLHDTKDGRFIFADQKLNDGNLSDESQNLLTKLIINYLFQEKNKGNDFFFRQITDVIKEIFPKEEKSVYFIAAREEESHQSHAKGKLVERRKNVARKLRSVGAIGYDRIKHSSNLNNTTLTEFSEDIVFAKNWLANEGSSSQLDETFMGKWRLTYDIRKCDIFGSCTRHLETVFKLWPALQGPRGYLLVAEDFNIGYPQVDINWNTFLCNWTVFTNFLLNLRRGSVKDKVARDLLRKLDAAQVNRDFRSCNVLKLLLLPYFVVTKTQIKHVDASNKQSKFWKPSQQESSAAFVCHVTNLSGVEEEIITRRLKYAQFGQTIQPYIILVGSDVDSIETCYVRVNEQLWSFQCPLKALDITFKLYFALHCEYPKQCSESWLILQLLVYKLVTPYDKTSSVNSNYS